MKKILSIKMEEKASHHMGKCHLFKASHPVSYTLVCVIIPTAAE